MEYTPNIFVQFLNFLGLYTEFQLDQLMRLQDIKRTAYTKSAYTQGRDDAKVIVTN